MVICLENIFQKYQLNHFNSKKTSNWLNQDKDDKRLFGFNFRKWNNFGKNFYLNFVLASLKQAV